MSYGIYEVGERIVKVWGSHNGEHGEVISKGSYWLMVKLDNGEVIKTVNDYIRLEHPIK